MTYDIRKATCKVGHYEMLTDDEGGRGRVVVLSLGEDRAWTYCWPKKNRGGDGTLLEWLAGTDIGYVAGKFRADTWFDVRKTVQSVHEYINELRRLDVFTGSQAARLHQRVDDVHSEDGWEDFVREMPDRSEEDGRIDDVYEHRHTGVDPWFRRAWDAVWPKAPDQVSALAPGVPGPGLAPEGYQSAHPSERETT